MRFSLSPKSALAAAAVIVTLGCAAPAAATVTLYAYTGTIREGHDATGVFGTAGRDLAGLAFTATFQRDDAAVVYNFQTADYSEVATFYGSRPATLTIEGGDPIAFAYGFGIQTQLDLGSSEGFSHDVYQTGDYDDVPGNFGSRQLHMGAGSADRPADYLPNGDYETLPSLTAAATPDFTWFGFVEIDEYVADMDTGEILSRNHANARFAPTSLTVTTVTTGVPEPAAWALMLTGFFGAGATLRSRRRAVASGGQPAH